MAEKTKRRTKYNTREELLKADEELRGNPALVGKSAMTHFRNNNSTRTQMFASHLDQAQTLLEPDFPNVGTGAENTVGDNSSGYKKTKADITIFRKVVKFEDLVDRPYVYQLFYYNHKKDRYDVVTRNEHKDLQQEFGFKYNNEFIDSLQEGDEVPEGTVLFKSTSYDDYMNYRYGRNLRTIYTSSLFTAEDSARISEYASEAMSYIHSKKIKWGWNTNDIPLNIHGTDDEYRPLPWIGETVEGYIASARPQINEQVLYDLAHRNLFQIRDSDRTIEYAGKCTIVDYDIRLNADEIPNDDFMHQVRILWDSQCKYWQQIQDTCIEIQKSGKDYSREVDLLFDKSRKFLNQDPNERWFNGTSIPGGIQFTAYVIERCKLEQGGKFTARYGNKCVVSKVLPNWQMPFDADGKRVDVELSIFAINNRTTGFVPHELYITWCMECCFDEMKKFNTIKEQADLFFDVLTILNEKQGKSMRKTFDMLKEKSQRAYLDSVMAGKYTVFHESLDTEEDPIFFKLRKVREKYTWLEPKRLYRYKFGQIYPTMCSYRVGSMYYFPLKQTDNKGFSARNTGAVNMKGLPERSYKNKRNEASYSDTPIRFGEYENTTWMIGLSPEELVATHALYRTSQEATTDLTKAQFMRKGYAMFKKIYKSRAAEIFGVIAKSLGWEIVFEDSDDAIDAIDSTIISEHTYKGKVYMCTDYDFYMIKLEDQLREKILESNPVLEGPELERLLKDEMENVSALIGPDTGKKAIESILKKDKLWMTARPIHWEEDPDIGGDTVAEYDENGTLIIL